MAIEQAFVIMQIGNNELDRIWKDIYIPVIKECGLEPRRVDKHTEGRLLNSEIADFIRDSKIIIADLTNERPNCYLEVGLTMGIGKFSNLILCAREDHNPSSMKYKPDGSKVHFDLSGYNIIWWDAENTDKFKQNISAEIRRRLELVRKHTVEKAEEEKLIPRNEEIILEERRKAIGNKIHKNALAKGFFEISAYPIKRVPNTMNSDLLKIAREAQGCMNSHTLGVVMSENIKGPVPKEDGIFNNNIINDTFFHSTLKNNGLFYFIESYFEDVNIPNKCRFETRVLQLIELFIYCEALYVLFNLQREDIFRIKIAHTGLENRELMFMEDNLGAFNTKYICTAGESVSVKDTSIKEISEDARRLVHEVSLDLFGMFNYFEPPRDVIDEIFNQFLKIMC